MLQGLHLRAGVVRQGQGLHHDPGEGLGFLQLEEVDALGAEHHQLQGILGGPRHALDDGLGADGVEISQAGRFERTIPLGGDDDFLLFGGQRRFHCRDRSRPADRQRHQQVRKQHRILQRQQR